MKFRCRGLSTLTAAIVGLNLAGCGEPEIQRKRSGPATPPPVTAAPGAPAPAEKTEVPSIFGKAGEEYTYNPVGRRDPFKAYAGELVQDITLPTSPLERYGLEQLKLTAIIWGLASPRALVQAPDGQSYIVRRDMRVGTHRGRISRITRREIFVEEEYRDPTGKLVVRESLLEIRPKGESEKERLQLQLEGQR
ncbi:MAG TPA: pilus assembly protein PilP [Bdellovibrionota bacterium]|nr:pilus assembly protein PilP [Bdellovibrionota bacterium]